jgi:hypothetical protein
VALVLEEATAHRCERKPCRSVPAGQCSLCDEHACADHGPEHYSYTRYGEARPEQQVVIIPPKKGRTR